MRVTKLRLKGIPKEKNEIKVAIIKDIRGKGFLEMKKGLCKQIAMVDSLL